MNPFDEQVGGNHYADMPIQPSYFSEKNGLSFLEGCIVKRICRYKTKGEPLKDLRKIQHEVEMLIFLGDYEGERGANE